MFNHHAELIASLPPSVTGIPGRGEGTEGDVNIYLQPTLPWEG